MYNDIQKEQAILPWKVLSLILFTAMTWQITNSSVSASRAAPVTTIEQAYTKPMVENKVMALPKPKPRFLSVVDTKEKILYNDSDLFCMAKNIYHEAGHESDLGKYAVAQVTVNRMKHPKYPDGICEVVLEPYQFSWANNRRIRWTKPAGPAWEESKEIARDVLVEGKRVYGLDRALFYHADYVRPVWASAKRRLTKIGAHIFYGYRGVQGA